MMVDLVETLLADAMSDLRELSSSGLASHLAVGAIVILGLGETAWLAHQRRGSQRSKVLSDTATAAVMGVGGLIVGIALAGLFVVGFGLVHRAAPDVASRFWADNRVVGFASAFVAWDLVGYLYHRIGHGTAIGWAAHRPHHTGDEFTLSLAWRQTWLPVHAVVLPLVAIGGWSLSTIVVCAAISNVVQAMQHTSAPIRFPGWVVVICMTPVQHRRHHHYFPATARPAGESPRTATAVNLGPVFTIWDRLAGTYVACPVGPNAQYGLGSSTTNPVRLQLEGWTELVRRRPVLVMPREASGGDGCADPGQGAQVGEHVETSDCEVVEAVGRFQAGGKI